MGGGDYLPDHHVSEKASEMPPGQNDHLYAVVDLGR